MKSGNTVTRFKLDYIRTNLFNNSGDIVALVHGNSAPVWYLPVLRVRSAHDYPDKNLVGIRLRDGRVDDLDLWP